MPTRNKITQSSNYLIFRIFIWLGAVVIFFTVIGLFGVFFRFEYLEQYPNLSVRLIYTLVIELLILLSIIAYRFTCLYIHQSESRLQKRIVGLIALLVSAPALVICVFSMLFLEIGLEIWISSQVKTALEESQNIANAYLEEHRQLLIHDVIAIARAFDKTFLLKEQTVESITAFLQYSTTVRQVTQALIIQINQNENQCQIIARAGFSASLELANMRYADVQRAANGEVILILNDKIGQARGLVKLRAGNNLFLYAGRYLSPQVVNQTAVVKGAVTNFATLAQQLYELKFGFLLTFVLFALLMIVISIYCSLNLAHSIASPIKRLTDAAKQIEAGDLKVRVNVKNLPEDETSELSHAFNSMARGLNEANQDIIRRRDFTENILRSVSTGIMSLNKNGKILSINQRAIDILEIDPKKVYDTNIINIFPEFSSFLLQSSPVCINNWENRLNLSLNSTHRAVIVRLRSMEAYQVEGLQEIVYILSLDDITELESAQRLAAWSEVAKRIAHEIRNPLTPIRLATERLRRNYISLLKKLHVHVEVSERNIKALHQSTETILRQVDNITSMVREFSNFARIPKANKQNENIVDICREAVFIEQNRGHQIHISAELPHEILIWACDRHQIIQLLINLLKNATEAINEHHIQPIYDAVILRLTYDDDIICIKVIDYGPGWPEERDKLFDPYYTLKKKGTGLGLAMVQRIVQEHSGECKLSDTFVDGIIKGGATVCVMFRRDNLDK